MWAREPLGDVAQRAIAALAQMGEVVTRLHRQRPGATVVAGAPERLRQAEADRGQRRRIRLRLLDGQRALEMSAGEAVLRKSEIRLTEPGQRLRQVRMVLAERRLLGCKRLLVDGERLLEVF